MAVGLVQQVSGSVVGAQVPSWTLPSATAAGSTLVLASQARTTAGSNPSINSVTDDLGNTWTRITGTQSTFGTSQGNHDWWICAAPATGTSVITVHFASLTGINSLAVIWELSGVDQSNPVDVVKQGTSAGASTTTPSTGTSAATARSNEIVLGLIGQNGSGTIGTATGYTMGTQRSTASPVFSGRGGYKSVTTTGTQIFNTTITVAAIWVATLVTIQPATGLSGTESVGVSDSADRTQSTYTNGSDSASVSDSAAGTLGFPRGGSDSVAISEAATLQTLGLIRPYPAESVTVSDAAAGTRGFPRTTADSVAVSDVATRSAQGLTRPSPADTVAVSDAAAGTRGFPRTAADSVAVSDVATRAALARVRGSADSVAVSDAAVRSLSYARTPGSLAAINGDFETDVSGWTQGFSGAGSQTFVRSTGWSKVGAASALLTASSLGVNAYQQRIYYMPNGTAKPGQTYTTRFSLNVAALGGASAVVTVGVGAFNSSGTFISQNLVNATTVGEHQLSVTYTTPTNTDHVFIAIAVSAGASGGGSGTVYFDDVSLVLQGDAIVVSDSASPSSTPQRTAADSVNVGDAATRAALAVARTAADSVGVSDAATRAALASVRTGADSITFSDSAARAALARIRSATDAFSVNDSAGRILAAARATADSISLSDAATRGALARITGASDVVSLSDSAVRIKSGGRSTTEFITITDVAVAVFSPVAAPNIYYSPPSDGRLSPVSDLGVVVTVDDNGVAAAYVAGGVADSTESGAVLVAVASGVVDPDVLGGNFNLPAVVYTTPTAGFPYTLPILLV